MSAEKSCFPFHQWDGCRCARCGKQRNTGHIYRWVKGFGSLRDERGCLTMAEGCRQVCVKCGAPRPNSFSRHQMEGRCQPVCKRCGEKGESHHQWEYPAGQCLRRCTVCGATEQTGHLMKGRLRGGRCEQYCTVCGFIREGHDWQYCRCTICGAINPNAKEHRWKEIREEDYVGGRRCEYCGKEDLSRRITRKERNRLDAEYDEVLKKMDSASEMRSVGFKI